MNASEVMTASMAKSVSTSTMVGFVFLITSRSVLQVHTVVETIPNVFQTIQIKRDTTVFATKDTLAVKMDAEILTSVRTLLPILVVTMRSV